MEHPDWLSRLPSRATNTFSKPALARCPLLVQRHFPASLPLPRLFPLPGMAPSHDACRSSCHRAFASPSTGTVLPKPRPGCISLISQCQLLREDPTTTAKGASPQSLAVTPCFLSSQPLALSLLTSWKSFIVCPLPPLRKSPLWGLRLYLVRHCFIPHVGTVSGT